jgi:predicted P-loop ATPase/GTPase
MEWDVTWTGNLVALLDAYKTTDIDYLGSSPIVSILPQYNGFSKRNTSVYPADKLYGTLVQFIRVSKRLIDVALKEIENKYNYMYCEQRFATLCAMHPWCLSADIAFGEYKNLYGPFSWDTDVSQSYLESHKNEQKLYHRAKW